MKYLIAILFFAACSAESVVDMPQVAPKVYTDSVADRSLNSFQIVAHVGVGGNGTERGVCYSTIPNPTLDDLVVSSGSGNGTYGVLVHPAIPKTRYYVKAYARNAKGISYGNEIDVYTNCPSSIGGVITYQTEVLNPGVPLSCRNISGTTTFVQIEDTGVYSIEDITFGLYQCVYGVSTGVVYLEQECSIGYLFGEDNQGHQYTWDATQINGTALVITWHNSNGDSGVSTLYRDGGWSNFIF